MFVVLAVLNTLILNTGIIYLFVWKKRRITKIHRQEVEITTRNQYGGGTASKESETSLGEYVEISIVVFTEYRR